MAEALAKVERKFNPYHDERGRFTYAPDSDPNAEGQNSAEDQNEIVVTASREQVARAKQDNNSHYQSSSIKSVAQAQALVVSPNGALLGKNAQCASLTKALAPEVVGQG